MKKKLVKFYPLHFFIRYTLRERKPTGDYWGRPYCKQKPRTALRHKTTGEVLCFATFSEAEQAVHSLIDSYRDQGERVISPTIDSHTKTMKGHEA